MADTVEYLMFAGYNFRAKRILDMFALSNVFDQVYIALCFLIAPDNPYTKDECDFLLLTDSNMYCTSF